MSHHQDETLRDSSWVAIGPSKQAFLPLVSALPTQVQPTKPATVGRGSDTSWAYEVSRVHGELVATDDGRIWFRDISTGGTYFNDGSGRQLPFGEWVDVTGMDLCLGSSVESPARRLQFRNLAAALPPSTAPKRKPARPKAAPAPPPAQIKLLHELGKVQQPKMADVRVHSQQTTQSVPRGDVIRNPSWEAVPERLAELDDSVSSGYKVTIDETRVLLPLNGRPVPFGSDPHLQEQGGIVIDSGRVSRIHGFVRFNPFGGPILPDGNRGGCLEIYDGNGKGRPSTNHIFCQSPGQPIGTPIPPGTFHMITLEDTTTLADKTVVITYVTPEAESAS